MFHFINYCTPNWYFNSIKLQNYNSYLLNYDELSPKDKSIIEFDNNYSSREISLLDASFQGLKKGLIIMGEIQQLDYECLEPTIRDNYRFIKKFYGFPWSLFVFFIRLFSLKNPIIEIIGFLSNLNVKRIRLFDSFNKNNLEEFESSLVKSMPKVSIIIPTLNRYQYLDRCIKDLENQTYRNFELIVVDQSEPFDTKFYENRSIDIKLIHQESKGLWKARNNGIRKSLGEYILLYDDDSIIETNWIEMHLKCIDFYNVEVSSGVSLATIGSKIPTSYSFYRWADQIDTGNVLIKKDVFRKIGLFDEQFEGMRLGDGEFGYRAFLQSIPMISNPEAYRIHLKVETGGLRQMGSWDAFRPTKLFAPKPIPSVIYFYKRYLHTFNYRMTIFIGLLLSNIKYENKKHNYFLMTSMIKSIFLFPVVLFQYRKSKKIANKMLLNGPKINFDI